MRLYSVDETGRRGIVFLSLDTDRAIVVAGARAAFRLPYRWARMRYVASGDVRTYSASPAVAGRARLAARSSYAWGRRAPPRRSTSSSAPAGVCTCGADPDQYVPNEHAPWPIHDAEVLELDDGLRGRSGSASWRGEPPDHVAFSPGVHTEFAFPGDASRPRSA